MESPCASSSSRRSRPVDQSTVHTQLANLKQKSQVVVDRYNRLEAANKLLSQQIAEERQRYDQQLAACNQQLRQEQQKCQVAVSSAQSLAVQHASKESEAAELKQQLANLQAEVETLRAQNIEYVQHKSEHKQQSQAIMQELEATAHELRRRNAGLENIVETRLRSLETELADRTRLFTSEQEQRQATEVRLEAQTKEYKANIAQLEATAQQLRTSNAELQNKVETHVRELFEANQKLIEERRELEQRDVFTTGVSHTVSDIDAALQRADNQGDSKQREPSHGEAASSATD